MTMTKPAKPKRHDRTVKIEDDLAERAVIIAKQLGYGSAAAYLSSLLRPLIDRDWPKARKRLDSLGQKGSEE